MSISIHINVLFIDFVSKDRLQKKHEVFKSEVFNSIFIHFVCKEDLPTKIQTNLHFIPGFLDCFEFFVCPINTNDYSTE